MPIQSILTSPAVSLALPVLRDPYSVAYLRGGAVDAVRTAIFVLLERGALIQSGPMLVRARRIDAFGLRPLERRVLDRYSVPHTLGTVLHDIPFLEHATADCDATLKAAGLLDRRPSPDLATQRALRWALVCLLGIFAVGVAWMSLGWIAGAWMGAAASPGGGAVVGLAGWTAQAASLPLAATAYLMLKPARRRVTRAGRDALAEVSEQHRFRLALGPQEHAGMDDALWLAAVVGVAALPADHYPAAQIVMPRAAGQQPVVQRNTRSRSPRTPPRRLSGVSNTTLNSLR
ncbi:TIGR04222 domain-containing membrane protein [Pigmentiphaga litoralis]|uniref:TIGR04222 domain-containing membrane protein n=1 Tax=Pigmentiphaga litoralis TaxID=516702 RepID=UPI003B430370